MMPQNYEIFLLGDAYYLYINDDLPIILDPHDADDLVRIIDKYDVRAWDGFDDSNDEIAKKMTEVLYPVLTQYRKEIMIIIGPDAPSEAASLKIMVEQGLMKNFLAFDPDRTPKGFAETLVKMLMAGIENILINYKSDKNMKDQIESMLRYHLRGVLAFSMLRKENKN